MSCAYTYTTLPKYATELLNRHKKMVTTKHFYLTSHSLKNIEVNDIVLLFCRTEGFIGCATANSKHLDNAAKKLELYSDQNMCEYYLDLKDFILFISPIQIGKCFPCIKKSITGYRSASGFISKFMHGNANFTLMGQDEGLI